MSESNEQQQPTPEPVPDTPAPPAPASPEAPDAPEQPEEERQSRGDRRFAELTARLSAAERREQERERELAFYRQQATQVAPQDETPEQRYTRERAEIRADVEAQVRAESFHNQGAAQFGDWRQRCDDLVEMGADAQFAQLLVEMPDGVRVAAALVDDPGAVERIAGLRSERARAIALGKFAATIEGEAHPGNGGMRVNGAAAPTPVQMTRAPAPVRPVTGRAAPTFNEYTADPQSLVDRYMKQALEKQVEAIMANVLITPDMITNRVILAICRRHSRLLQAGYVANIADPADIIRYTLHIPEITLDFAFRDYDLTLSLDYFAARHIEPALDEIETERAKETI